MSVSGCGSLATSAFHIEDPQVPSRADKVGRCPGSGAAQPVRQFPGAVALIAEVPLGDGDFRGIDGLNAQVSERALELESGAK